MKRRSRDVVQIHVRRGMVVLLVVIAMLICTSISVSLAQTLLLQEQRVAHLSLKHQADLLAQSALDRADRLLARNSQLSESLWEIPADDAGRQARVLIRFQPGAAEGVRRVAITADLSAGPRQQVRTTLQSELRLPSPTGK